MIDIVIGWILRIYCVWFLILTKLFGFYSVSQRISRIPYAIGIRLRYIYYRKTLKSIGENVVFSFGTILSHPDISIGNNVRIGPYNTIGLVDIGDDFMSAQFVQLMSGKHQHSSADINIPMRLQKGELKRIAIQPDVWIGVNSVVMADIGRGSVIAAGSIVINRVEDYSVMAGNPAKLIKRRV